MLISFHMQMPRGQYQGLPSRQGLCAAAPAVPSLPLNGSTSGSPIRPQMGSNKGLWGAGDPGGLQMSTPAHRSYSSQWVPPSSFQDKGVGLHGGGKNEKTREGRSCLFFHLGCSPLRISTQHSKALWGPVSTCNPGLSPTQSRLSTLTHQPAQHTLLTAGLQALWHWLIQDIVF